MVALTSTRRYGTGCGSVPDGRKTKNGGRLTTASRPSVEVIPSVPTDQQSATISLIHLSQRRPAPLGSRLAARAQVGPQRLDQPELRGALVAHLVHQ